jgi:hypothetical protein
MTPRHVRKERAISPDNITKVIAVARLTPATWDGIINRWLEGYRHMKALFALAACVLFLTGTARAATVPGVPTGVSATAGNGSGDIFWTAPSDGGSVITSYTVTPFVGSTAQTPEIVTGSPAATMIILTGLTNGVAYTAIVSATNAVGTGPPSASSNSFTPTAEIPPATPLPAALPLFATGIGGLGLFGWRRKRKAQAVA